MTPGFGDRSPRANVAGIGARTVIGWPRGYTRWRACGTDRGEPGLHQLDAAGGPGRGWLLGRRAGEVVDVSDARLPRLHGPVRRHLRRARLPVGYGAAGRHCRLDG